MSTQRTKEVSDLKLCWILSWQPVHLKYCLTECLSSSIVDAVVLLEKLALAMTSLRKPCLCRCSILFSPTSFLSNGNGMIPGFKECKENISRLLLWLCKTFRTGCSFASRSAFSHCHKFFPHHCCCCFQLLRARTKTSSMPCHFSRIVTMVLIY